MSLKNLLIVIPARGGSKGIPRKNLRALNNRPLIYYSIKNALNLKKQGINATVIVSSEDDEILTIAKKIGALTHKRDISLSEDKTTLDSVIFDAYINTQEKLNINFDIIMTMQATSPLLSVNSIRRALKQFDEDSKIDTIISATNDTHLTWIEKDNKKVPNYTERLNRQELPPVYKETGGFLITRKHIITKNSRIGNNVELFLLPYKESIDIDTKEDWILCEHFLKSKKLLFVTKGYKEIGLGHIYNTLSLANEFASYDIQFLVEKNSALGFDKIKENNYNVKIQTKENILEEINIIQPDIIINDLLDTSEVYMKSLSKICSKIVNFEDLGKGSKYANIVFNAMYPEKEKIHNHYFAQNYFILRDEFIYTNKIKINEKVKTIIVSFGGVDPNDYTHKVLEIIYPHCIKKEISIRVVTGMGYKNTEIIKKRFPKAIVSHNIRSISDEFAKGDLAFTSAGRTTFELSSLGIPTIVLCQNKRETTHFFADNNYGFKNLGLIKKDFNTKIEEAFKYCLQKEQRLKMHNTMKKIDLKLGKKKVITLIKQLIES